MKRITSIFIIFIMLCFVKILFGSGMALSVAGARATALGGNFRSLADDWSAMFWNPAGITQIRGVNFGTSLMLIKPATKYSYYQNVPSFSIYNVTEVESERKTFPIPTAGFVYGTGKMGLGLIVFSPFGLGVEWDVMNTVAYNPDYPIIEFKNNFKTIVVQPTFAYKLTNDVAFGFGLSVVYSDIIMRKPTITQNPVICADAYQALRDAFGAYNLTALTGDPYNHILTEQELNGTGFGFGVNLGIKYDINKNLAIGFSGIYYHTNPLAGNISAVTYGAKVDPALYDGLNTLLSGLVLQQQLDEASKQELLKIYDGEKHVNYSGADCDTDMPLPMTIGAGIAYKGISNLLISSDISWTRWSSWNVLGVEIEDGKKFELVQDWKDGVRFGIGLEYEFSEPLSIQFSYYTEPSAVPEKTLSIAVPDINRQHVIHIGTSYNLGVMKVSMSYEKFIIGNRNVESWNYNPLVNDYNNMAGTYKAGANTFMFGIDFCF